MLRTEKTIKGRLRCGCKWSVSSVAELCPTLCNPMDCSILGLLSITNSRSSLKLMFIESVMPSNHLIFCHPLLLLPSIFPSIRVFSKELVLHIKWPKYWNFSFSISLSNEPLDFLPLLQAIFPMQGLNPGLLHCRQILYHSQHPREEVYFSGWQV